MPETTSDVLARLKDSCAFIESPDGSGTGYLVAPQRIATALHVVKAWKEQQIYPVTIAGTVCQARFLKSDPATDAAILAFDEKIEVTPLPIADVVERNVAWESYGFPALARKADQPTGLPLDGQIKDPQTTNDAGQQAILLYSDAVAAGSASPLHGFSGSPVVVDGAIVGHLTKHIGDADDRRRAAYGYVYACPIKAVVKLLDVAATRTNITPPRLETIADAVPEIAASAYHVFVSYRSTDHPWAMSLVARLEGAGLRVFIDQRELMPGEYLAAQIESALGRSLSAVVLVSKGWLESPWCQQEAEVLKKRTIEDKEFRLIPLRLDDSAMPRFLDARVWLDFNGKPRAEGENLDRLLNALVGREPPAEGSLVARADAAQTRVVDQFVAQIKAATTGDTQRIVDIVADWRKIASPDVAPIVAAAEVFIGKGQFASALSVLDGAQATLRVRQLRAFALRKMGAIDEAIAQFETLCREGIVDAETSGLLAGSYKARWLKTGDRAFLQRAYRVYSEAYDRSADSFTGINTAAMALQCHDEARMYEVASQVRADLLRRPIQALSHWDLATLGEGCLLLKRFEEAQEWYEKAAAEAAGLHQDIAVMRRQARLDLATLGQPRNQFDDILPVPRVLAYFGHMVDAENRETPRFPPSKVGALRNAIRARLVRYGALHGFGQASRGTDLIVLEELIRRGLTATVVLPFPDKEFLLTSVGGKWTERFERVRSDKAIEWAVPLMRSRPADKDLPEAFDAANRELQRRALELARRLDETPVVLAVWDGKKGDGPGGTGDAVALWRDEGCDVDVIDINTL